ncbi:hypothetical protein [Chitinophaga agri]|uniref:Uncharacterized protein n=1 Tax=Chitinophaga agri TaxID=2703787 RepID=A0A6B9ZFT7_9BACT|nr:hypothetical protein [Chitinophaga agri]QHS59955.1 hypothetical protein GWR21_10230 [Chitinophaga agri]
MSYYIRILGTENPDIHLDDILEALNDEGVSGKIGAFKNELPEKWTRFELRNEKDKVLAVVERDAVKADGMGKEELDEFRETIMDFQPATAAKWLNNFFDRVTVIYAFRLLPLALEEENYPIVTAAQSFIWEKVKGILQADDEGFTNEEGYHILWQFGDDEEGPWSCAVLNADGKWENFSMELGDKEQQKAFKQGQVPAGAQRL